MKEYLTKAERTDLLYICNLLDRVEDVVEEWGERGNLKKEEKKYLKMCCTWGIKAFESILYRQNKPTVLNIQKEKEKSAIHLDLRHSLEVISKRKSNDLAKAYEENKEYFKLVELILLFKCNGCTTPCEECEIFSEFTEQCIPYMDGDGKKPNCKYSY